MAVPKTRTSYSKKKIRRQQWFKKILNANKKTFTQILKPDPDFPFVRKKIKRKRRIKQYNKNMIELLFSYKNVDPEFLKDPFVKVIKETKKVKNPNYELKIQDRNYELKSKDQNFFSPSLNFFNFNLQKEKKEMIKQNQDQNTFFSFLEQIDLDPLLKNKEKSKIKDQNFFPDLKTLNFFLKKKKKEKQKKKKNENFFFKFPNLSSFKNKEKVEIKNQNYTLLDKQKKAKQNKKKNENFLFKFPNLLSFINKKQVEIQNQNYALSNEPEKVNQNLQKNQDFFSDLKNLDSFLKKNNELPPKREKVEIKNSDQEKIKENTEIKNEKPDLIRKQKQGDKVQNLLIDEDIYRLLKEKEKTTIKETIKKIIFFLIKENKKKIKNAEIFNFLKNIPWWIEKKDKTIFSFFQEKSIFSEIKFFLFEKNTKKKENIFSIDSIKSLLFLKNKEKKIPCIKSLLVYKKNKKKKKNIRFILSLLFEKNKTKKKKKIDDILSLLLDKNQQNNNIELIRSLLFRKNKKNKQKQMVKFVTLLLNKNGKTVNTSFIQSLLFKKNLTPNVNNYFKYLLSSNKIKKIRKPFEKTMAKSLPLPLEKNTGLSFFEKNNIWFSSSYTESSFLSEKREKKKIKNQKHALLNKPEKIKEDTKSKDQNDELLIELEKVNQAIEIQKKKKNQKKQEKKEALLLLKRKKKNVKKKIKIKNKKHTWLRTPKKIKKENIDNKIITSIYLSSLESNKVKKKKNKNKNQNEIPEELLYSNINIGKKNLLNRSFPIDKTTKTTKYFTYNIKSFRPFFLWSTNMQPPTNLKIQEKKSKNKLLISFLSFILGKKKLEMKDHNEITILENLTKQLPLKFAFLYKVQSMLNYIPFLSQFIIKKKINKTNKIKNENHGLLRKHEKLKENTEEKVFNFNFPSDSEAYYLKFLKLNSPMKKKKKLEIKDKNFLSFFKDINSDFFKQKIEIKDQNFFSLFEKMNLNFFFKNHGLFGEEEKLKIKDQNFFAPLLQKINLDFLLQSNELLRKQENETIKDQNVVASFLKEINLDFWNFVFLINNKKKAEINTQNFLSDLKTLESFLKNKEKVNKNIQIKNQNFFSSVLNLFKLNFQKKNERINQNQEQTIKNQDFIFLINLFKSNFFKSEKIKDSNQKVIIKNQTQKQKIEDQNVSYFFKQIDFDFFFKNKDEINFEDPKKKKKIKFNFLLKNKEQRKIKNKKQRKIKNKNLGLLGKQKKVKENIKKKNFFSFFINFNSLFKNEKETFLNDIDSFLWKMKKTSFKQDNFSNFSRKKTKKVTKNTEKKTISSTAPSIKSLVFTPKVKKKKISLESILVNKNIEKKLKTIKIIQSLVVNKNNEKIIKTPDYIQFLLLSKKKKQLKEKKKRWSSSLRSLLLTNHNHENKNEEKVLFSISNCLTKIYENEKKKKDVEESKKNLKKEEKNIEEPQENLTSIRSLLFDKNEEKKTENIASIRSIFFDKNEKTVNEDSTEKNENIALIESILFSKTSETKINIVSSIVSSVFEENVKKIKIKT